MRLRRTRLNLIDAAESMRAFISLNEPLSGFDAVRSVCAQAGVTAIVKQNDMSVSSIAIDSLARVVLDRVGRCAAPIEAGYIPHHGLKPAFARSREHRRATRSKGRTKEFRHRSCGVGNDLRAVGQLADNVAAGLQEQIGMIDGVVRDQMSGPDNRARNLRTRFHKSADQKESCFHFVPRKDIEKPFGMNVVGAVIISERQVARIRTARKRRPKQLRARRISVICEESSRRDRSRR